MSTFLISQNNISDVLDKNQIVLLNFWGPTCEPCKIFKRIFNETSNFYPDIYFGEVNAEVEHLLCSDFEIRATPTLVIFKEGYNIYQESGVIPEYALKNIIEKAKTIKIDELN